MAGYARTQTSTRGANRPTGGRNSKYFGLYIGIVKHNEDIQGMGRLQVWIPDFGSAPNESGSWITVSYCSPFAGITSPENLGKGSDKVEHFEHSQTSYGMWFVPPDLENKVAVMFDNGDLGRGYWFGCVYDQYMNNMVPGVPAGKNFEDAKNNLPTSEYNKYTTATVNQSNTTRPTHTYQAEGVLKQGLAGDPIRGTSTSGARRESPSQVYGLLTPGPFIGGNKTNRKGGSSMVFDDGEGTEHISFQTRGGAKIKLDETNGIVYIANRDATGWVEISESGQIQVYGKSSVSIRAGEDVNIYADNDVNIEAGNNINMKANANTNLESTADYNNKVGGKHTEQSDGERGIKSTNFDLEYGGSIETSGTIHGLGSITSSGDIVSSMQSLNALYQHSHGGISSGLGNTLPFGQGGSPTSASGPTVSPLPTVSKTDVTHDNSALTFDKATQTIQTIVSKFMTAEPCRDHEK